MSLSQLLIPEIQTFIRDHQNDDPAQLALAKFPVGWPRGAILDQIIARQKAARKTPEWLEFGDFVFPSTFVMEQASSTATARYKSGLAQQWLQDMIQKRVMTRYVDLTAGAGVDGFAFYPRFSNGILVEKDPDLAEIVRHNTALLGYKNLQIINDFAEKYIQDMPEVDLAYIDPARRNTKTKGLIQLGDSSPNVLAILCELLEKAALVMIKTSPMLDIQAAINSIKTVRCVVIVEAQKQCKEVLYLCTKDSQLNDESPLIRAVQIDDHGDPVWTVDARMGQEDHAPTGAVQRYLYEPGPAVMKAGLFAEIERRFKVTKLHPHTHLFTCDAPVQGFPGRSFEVISIDPVKRDPALTKANLSVRNFPDTVDGLKKKLKLKDGGEIYLFACTLHDGSKKLIRCRKV